MADYIHTRAYDEEDLWAELGSVDSLLDAVSKDDYGSDDADV